MHVIRLVQKIQDFKCGVGSNRFTRCRGKVYSLLMQGPALELEDICTCNLRGSQRSISGLRGFMRRCCGSGGAEAAWEDARTVWSLRDGDHACPGFMELESLAAWWSFGTWLRGCKCGGVGTPVGIIFQKENRSYVGGVACFYLELRMVHTTSLFYMKRTN